MRDTQDVTKAMFNSPNERARALAVFGPDGMEKIQARMTLETIMDGARRAMGNSTTARQLIESGLAGGALGGYEAYRTGFDPVRTAEAFGIGAGARLGVGKVIGSEMAAGARNLIGRVDARTARNVAELLTSDDPSRIQRGLGIAMRNQRIMNGLRRTANALSVSALAPSGREAGIAAAPAIQSAAGSRADERRLSSRGAPVFDPSQPFQTF